MNSRDHPLYSRWREMRKRCELPGQCQYHLYGARGIRVCERWKRFWNFVEDMGVPPPGMTLDRIDNDGNYEPGNVRWATWTEQANNKRTNRIVIVRGVRMTMSQAARKYGKTKYQVFERLKAGWSDEDAVLRPVRRKKPNGPRIVGA